MVLVCIWVEMLFIFDTRIQWRYLYPLFSNLTIQVLSYLPSCHHLDIYSIYNPKWVLVDVQLWGDSVSSAFAWYNHLKCDMFLSYFAYQLCDMLCTCQYILYLHLINVLPMITFTALLWFIFILSREASCPDIWIHVRPYIIWESMWHRAFIRLLLFFL